MKRNFIKLTKISWKLTLLYASIFSLVLILLTASVLYGVQYFLFQQTDSEVEAVSTALVMRIKNGPGDIGALTDPELINAAGDNADTYIRIALPNRRVVNASSNIKINPALDRQLGQARRVNIHKSRLTEWHYLIRNDRVRQDGRTIAYVQVLRDLRSEYRFIELLTALIITADLMGIIISVIAGFILSKRLLNPIDKITTTARNISSSDLSSRIEVYNQDDEIGRLALTFNDMIGRLQHAFEKQKQFVSDASHEMKTPISIIQGYINLMDRWGKEDKNILQESINAIKKETSAMKDMIEKLLVLAGGDSNSIILHKEVFNLRELLAEIIAECELIDSEHKFDYVADKKLALDGDRKWIKQMLRALLDNSIKYTPEAGKISVSAESRAGQVKIVVKDTGIGIPADELDNIFTRFYRVDKSRDKESGGSGLGLAIVQWITEAHGGSISAQSEVSKGTSICIWLPGN